MSAGQEVLDRAHLARYTLGDAALEREVLGLFIDQIPETLAQLRNSTDTQSWVRAAHTIKGSARAVGAWKLATIAENAEKCVEDHRQWPRIAADIEAALSQVRDEMAEPV